PELKAFMSWSHHPQTEKSQYTRLVDIQAQYWGGQDMVFHIWSEDDEQLLGSIGLHHLRPLHPRGREIGYWVRTSATGQGVASRAAMALVAWGFGHQGYLRMQCGFNRSNTASRRVSEKVGFRHEAELTLAVDPPTEAMKRDGAIDDPISYQTVLLAQDIPQLPWYPELLGRLEVFDWCEERVSIPSKGD
ncbi:MAG: GNAT family N-acetyltransferase, partial [Myxococcota bacterium]